MSLLILAVYFSSMAVYIYGKYRDYTVSVSRIENPEQNPMYRDANGRFDAKKFKKYAIFIFLACLVNSIPGLFIIYGLLLPSAVFLAAGIIGLRAARS